MAIVSKYQVWWRLTDKKAIQQVSSCWQHIHQCQSSANTSTQSPISWLYLLTTHLIIRHSCLSHCRTQYVLLCLFVWLSAHTHLNRSKLRFHENWYVWNLSRIFLKRPKNSTTITSARRQSTRPPKCTNIHCIHMYTHQRTKSSLVDTCAF